MGYNSDQLINAIKRNGMFPSSQKKFTNSDYLKFLNEELKLTLINELMKLQEGYLITHYDTDLVASTSEYDIPNIAVGWVLDDIGYIDDNDNYMPLPRYDEHIYREYETTTSASPSGIYVENYSVKTIPQMSSSASGSLRFHFVRLQNELVETSSCGEISLVTDTTASVNVSTCADNGSGEIRVTTASDHIANTGDTVVVAAVTGTTEANGTWTCTRIDATHLDLDDSEYANAYVAGGTVTYDVYQCTVDTLPNYASGVDFISGTNPYNIFVRDIEATSAGLILTVTQDQLERTPIIGDWVCSTGETVYPNIPDDYHHILPQLALIRCLGAINDQKGIQSAQLILANMIDQMKTRSANRIKSAPRKIIGKSYILNSMRG